MPYVWFCIYYLSLFIHTVITERIHADSDAAVKRGSVISRSKFNFGGTLLFDLSHSSHRRRSISSKEQFTHQNKLTFKSYHWQINLLNLSE